MIMGGEDPERKGKSRTPSLERLRNMEPKAIEAYMSIRQKIFCREYVANGYCAKDAARFAGFKESHCVVAGSKLLAEDTVKAYIEKFVEKIQDKCDVTIEWKINALKKIVESCLAGNAIGCKDRQVHPSGAVSAIAELNRMQGHYPKEKSNINLFLNDPRVKDLVATYEKEF